MRLLTDERSRLLARGRFDPKTFSHTFSCLSSRAGVANFLPQNLHGHLLALLPTPETAWSTDEETLAISAEPESRIRVTELSVITAGSEHRSRPSTDDSKDVRAEIPKVGELRSAKFVDWVTGITGSGGDDNPPPFKNEAEIYDGSISNDDRS